MLPCLCQYLRYNFLSMDPCDSLCMLSLRCFSKVVTYYSFSRQKVLARPILTFLEVYWRVFFSFCSSRAEAHHPPTSCVPSVPAPRCLFDCVCLLSCRACVFLKKLEEALIGIGSQDVGSGAWWLSRFAVRQDGGTATTGVAASGNTPALPCKTRGCC